MAEMFKCPAGCSLVDCNSNILTDDFDPKIDHGKHIHHNMTMSCTCNDGSCDDKIPTDNSSAQIAFGVLFGLICIIGAFLNSCILDFGLFEFEGGIVNYFLKSYQSNGIAWKYLLRTGIFCLVVGFAMSFVTSFSVLLINFGLLLLLFMMYIHILSKRGSSRQDSGLMQQLYGLLPLRPRNS